LAGILFLFMWALTIYSKNITLSDNSLPVWLDHDDPDYIDYQNYLKEFKNDRLMAVAFEVGDPFGNKELNFIKDLSSELEKLPQIKKVLSITNAQYIESKEDEIIIKGLFDTLPNDKRDIDEKKAIAVADKNLNGVVFNLKTNVSAIYLTLDIDSSVQSSNKFLEILKTTVNKLNTYNYSYHMVGAPVSDAAFQRLSLKDQERFLPVIYLVIFCLTFIFFRNVWVAIIPLVVQAIVVILVVALYFALGHTMNIVASIMGPVLVAVCVADSVHMMLNYYENREKGFVHLESIILAAENALVPCFFTSLTTFAGFIAFNASSIVPNKVLGVYTACGVMLAYVFTIFFIPLLLSFLSNKDSKYSLLFDENHIQRFLNQVYNIVIRHKFAVVLVFLLGTIVSSYGISRIHIETNVVEYFPKLDPVRLDINFFEKHLAGVGTFELILKGQDPSREIAKDPRVLKLIEDFRNEAMGIEFMAKIFSYTDYIKKLNRAFHNNNEKFYIIPDTQGAIAQLLLLAESSGDGEIDDFKNMDDTKIHLSIKNFWRNSELMSVYLKKLKKMADSYFKPIGVDMTLTGFEALWVKINDSLLKSEFYSFGAACIMVILMMIVVLRNWQIGLLSMIPNLVPILFALGIMGLLGIHLNLTTVMTAGVAIGITVDDSIHYLIRFKKILSKVGDYHLAIKETNKSIGTAVIFTSTVLVFGFGVLCLSQFSPSVDFGASVALTLFLSIFCEIFLMPIILITIKPFKISEGSPEA